MQRNTTIVIVVLAAIGLLFLMGVGTVVLRGDGEGSRQRAASDQAQGGWVAGLGGLVAPFGPKLDVETLQCGPQKLSRPFRLDGDRPACSVVIGPSASERPRRAVLSVEPVDASVYVLSEGEPPPDSDPACRPADSSLPGRLVLKVEYAPRGEEPLERPCWLRVRPTERRTGAGVTQRLEVGFAVLKEGGTVSLTCEGCSAERRLDLEFVR
jgi:hypothetical protein